MCGIAGVVSKSNELDPLILKKMNSAISHRGPNGSGEFISGSFMFGHTRLAIVDVSIDGHQPMHFMDRYVITYNGEIYNHIELRRELEAAGYKFQSKTDTEVIMAAYDFWGENCFNRFNGMWAFVIYDRVEDRFIISRDRFGIKPLYFYRDENVFIFASEVKAILEHPAVNADANLDYLEGYLKDGAKEWLEYTAFKDIHRFPCASYIISKTENLCSSFEAKLFWQVTPNLDREKFCPKRADKLANQYFELLSDAVKIRLRADVKVGSALSGGLDSSSIVLLVNEHLKNQGKEELQQTFSSVYKSHGTTDCDESEYIDALAKFLKVESNQIEPKESEISRAHQDVIKAMENPPESCLMSSWYTYSKVAETNVKVTLDGQGADEQLAGYLVYIRQYLLSISIMDFIKEVPKFLKIPGAKRQVKVAILMRAVMSVFGRKALKKAFKRVKGRKLIIDLNEELDISTKTTLQTLIHYADHTSMAHGIESRMPFMDYRVIEFLSSVPACYKMHNGWTKYLARLAFDKKLPDDICWRKDKMGWPVPEEHWYRGSLKGWLIELVNGSKLDKKLVGHAPVEEVLESKEPIKRIIRRLNVALFEDIFLSKKA